MSDSLAFDVCIVGSGFAGSVLASELASTGKKIAIVEAGDWEDREAVQRAVLTGTPPIATSPELHSPISVRGNVDWQRGWSYGVGGHVRWTAWAIRPFENSFQTRSLYGVGEDWPISYDDLELDYGRAEEALGVSGNSVGGQGPRRSHPFPMEAFPFSYAETQFIAACSEVGIKIDALPVARNRIARHGRDACCFSGTCVFCPTTAKYRADLAHVPEALAAKNVTLLTRHVALKLVAEHGRIVELVCGRPDHSTVKITAGTFIVACNTIESTRLLLGSAQPGHPNGLGNRSGTVGRYLTAHLDGGGVDGLSTKPLWAQRTMPAVLGRQFEDGPHRKEHAGFHVSMAGDTNPTSAALDAVGQGLFGVALKRDLQRQVTCPVSAGGSVEMLPVAANGIELDPSVRDFFGRPGMKLTLNVGDYEKRGSAALQAALTPVLQKLGCTDISGGEVFSTGFHHMGTLRMGKDPTRSVVDPNLRTHDVDNLYIASSAVYPSTLGPTNPTLTLVALSYRLAAHLRKDVLR